MKSLFLLISFAEAVVHNVYKSVAIYLTFS